MSEQPSLETRRLLLRPFSLVDAPAVRRLAGDERIAATTLNIPHPYEPGMAEDWIDTHQESYDRGGTVHFAVVRRQDSALFGAIGLRIEEAYDWAELGYWIGVRNWNKGYCTEAARAVVDYAFQERGLNRIHAQHLLSNPASGRVLQKVGMTHEGVLRQHVKKRARYEDIVCYGLLRSEWEAGSSQE